MYKKLLAGLLIALAAPALFASSYLFYLEAQGIAGWSSAAKKYIFYSMMPAEVMQKPSLGFDYVQKFSGASGDIATLAVQGRLAVNTEGGTSLQPQLYNAFLKIKTGWADVWIGHNKPQMGLSSTLDNHGTLLQPLSMSGFGFDRDWGLGLERNFEGGSAGLSLTTGSGMRLKLGHSYLLAGRASLGVLNQDNFSAGVSAAVGDVYDVMGYKLLTDKPAKLRLAGLDATWVSNTWENGVEVMGGTRDGSLTLAAFWRTGLGLLAESRLKIEAQPALFWVDGAARFQGAVGATYQATPDLTLRTMVAYDSEMKDAKVLFQIYYYKGIRL
jgi:hypothetical protein